MEGKAGDWEEDAADAVGEDEFCARCKSFVFEELLKGMSDFTLRVAKCGHKICKRCETTLWARSSAAVPCPRKGCTAYISRQDLATKSVEQMEYEAERKVRGEINEIYNRSRHDFRTTEDYDLYLEKKEMLVFTLMTGSPSEKAEAQAEVSAYASVNGEQIRRQRADQAEADRRVKEQLEAVKRERMDSLKAGSDARLKEKRQRVLARHEALDDLVTGQQRVVARTPLEHVPVPRPIPKLKPAKGPAGGPPQSAAPGAAGAGAGAGGGVDAATAAVPAPPLSRDEHRKLRKAQLMAGGFTGQRMRQLEVGEATLTLAVVGRVR